jgi:ketosteroid isomerase-like protein
MSQQNIELVRSAFDAWSDGDLSRAVSALDPDIEWEMAEDEPDARTLHGQAEVRDMLRGWAESFDELLITPHDFIDAGQHVVVPIGFVARPHGAEASLTIEETQVFTVRGDTVVRVCEYRTKAEALEAVHLSELRTSRSRR